MVTTVNVSTQLIKPLSVIRPSELKEASNGIITSKLHLSVFSTEYFQMNEELENRMH